MSRISFAAAALTFVLTAGAGAAYAQSAVLTQVQGNVLVNSGSGFTPAGSGTAVQVGSQVSVQGPGSATIDFGNGRTLVVPGSSTVVVRAPTEVDATQSLVPAVVGGALAAGAIAAVVSIANNDSNTVVLPVSP